MIAVTSSQPASGKSVIAANLAFELAKTKSVCLVDADLVQSSQHIYFGLTNAPASLSALTRLLQQERLLESDLDNLTLELVVPGAKVTLIAGVPNQLTVSAMTRESFETLIEFLELRYDEVVYDLSSLGSEVSELQEAVLSRSNKVLLTCLADQVSVHRFITNLETLSQHVDLEKCLLIINRVRESVLGSKPAKQLSDTFAKHTPFAQPTLIAEDQNFDEAMFKSLPLSFVSKKSTALPSIEALAETLITVDKR